MRVYDWEYLERQHNSIARLVVDQDVAGIARLFLEACDKIGWADAEEKIGDRAMKELQNTLAFWMNVSSIPLNLYGDIRRVVDEIVKEKNQVNTDKYGGDGGGDE
tara:strand:+ start:6257 stop:6571 length:315 start_codon:yes stop_codon:yes gene_type:complete